MLNPINWSPDLPLFLAAFGFGYIMGSVPYSLIFSRLAGLGDIRKIGSGNVGATNVLRTGNIPIAAASLIADMLKGALAYAATLHFYGQDMAMAAGLGAFLGHCFPIWLKFTGGKGVAVYLGVLLPISLTASFIFGVVWIVVAALSRYASLASLSAAVVTPFSLYFCGYIPAAKLYALLAGILVVRHCANILRLVKGRENRIGGG